MTTLARLRQRRYYDEGNSSHCDNGKDACASMATTPSEQVQQCHCDDGKDACASMITTMPLQQGQQCQLEDSNNAIRTRATRPLQIKGNNAIVTRTTTPARYRQGHLRINNGNNAVIMQAEIAIATTAKMPVHQWQQRHHDKGNDASLMTSDKGNNASLTTVETPVH
jgi:hypothetical protein